MTLAPKTMSTTRLPSSRPAASGAPAVVRRWPAALAAVAIASIGIRVVLPQGVTVGEIVALLLAPLWVPSFLRFRFGRAILALGLVALASGIVLKIVNASTNPVQSSAVIGTMAALVALLAAVGVVLWARSLLSSSSIVLAFGVGLVLGLYPLPGNIGQNPWKFAFALPVVVLALGLAQWSARWWLEVVVLLAVGVVSLVTDSRSLFGEILVALLLVVAQRVLRRLRGRGSAVRAVIGLVVLSVVVYFIGQWAILGGAFGRATQERSLAQVQAAGSLLLGGRPELAATVALMANHPRGFGVGVALTPDQILEAKTALQAVGYAPNNGYVEGYLFGGAVELHSIVGDLWAAFGPAGLLLAVVLLVALIWGLGRRIADREIFAAPVFLVVLALWFLAFGPLQTSVPVLAAAVGLVAIPLTPAALRAPRTRASFTPIKEPAWPTAPTPPTPTAQAPRAQAPAAQAPAAQASTAQAPTTGAARRGRSGGDAAH